MKLDEISRVVKRKENVQGLGGHEGTQTFSLVKGKSHKEHQGAARAVGRKPGESGVHRPSGFKEEGVINCV